MAGLIFHPEAKFRTTRDVETNAQTGYRTGSQHCVIPSGTTLRLGKGAGGVMEPTKQVRYDLIDPPEGEAYIATILPAAVEAGLFEDPEERPDKWRRVVYLDSLTYFVPENRELEELLIPEATRRNPDYEGCGFLLRLTMLGAGLDLISNASEIVARPDDRLYAKESFDTDGLRSDGAAATCRVPAEAIVVARYAVEKQHLVAGWELSDKHHTWWRTLEPRADEASMGWTRTERVCPSMFLANCDTQFAVEADRDWEALLISTDLIGRTLMIL